MASGRWDFEYSIAVGAVGGLFSGKQMQNPFRESQSTELTQEQRRANTKQAFAEARIFFEQQARR